MILQELLFPNFETCATYDMYFRLNDDLQRTRFDPQERCVVMKKNQHVYLDTYFNSFSIGKWKQYTCLDNLKLRLELMGEFRVQIIHKQMISGSVFMDVLGEYICRAEERRTFEFELPVASTDKGNFCCAIDTLGKHNVYYGGCYVTDVDETRLNKVDIAIDICTFRRETFVERNIALLNRNIIQNPESPVNGHLDVFISDNGKTLDVKKLQSDRVHIFPNKNVGGAGGFSRGMIEIIDYSKKRPFTHALVMDDDVLINTDAIVRTYRFLQFMKPKYAGKTIAGAMLRMDNRFMQHECGGFWDGEVVHPDKSFLDLRNIENVLRNEIEGAINYNAWWYSCIPMSKISDENLPLPIFIRFDDVEFGLRTGSDIVSLNGICLWHEPFEYKYSSSMEYYHARNCLIIDSFHKPEFGPKDAARHVMQMVRSNLVRYRYNNCELIFRAVADFCKGVDFMLNTDGEALHKEIMAASDKFQPLEQLEIQFNEGDYQASFNWGESKKQRYLRLLTFNGLLLPARGTAVVSAAVNAAVTFNRKKAVLNYDVSGNRGFVSRRDFKRSVATLLKAHRVARMLRANHARVSEEFRQNQKTLTSRSFWNRYLGLK